MSIAIDSDDVIYINDVSMLRVMRPDKSSGANATEWTWTVTTWINSSNTEAHVDGPASSAQFDTVYSMAVDSDKTLYLQENVWGVDGSYIRRVTPDGFVDTIAGTPTLTKVNGVSSYPGVLPGGFAYGWGIVADPKQKRLIFDVQDSTGFLQMPR